MIGSELEGDEQSYFELAYKVVGPSCPSTELFFTLVLIENFVIKTAAHITALHWTLYQNLDY
jgi:hypothetical protein